MCTGLHCVAPTHTGITGGLLRVSVGITGTKEQRWAQLQEAVQHVLHGPFRPISPPGVNATLTVGSPGSKSPGKALTGKRSMVNGGETVVAGESQGKRVRVGSAKGALQQ